MFFSIIVPIYNVQQYLEQCVNSVLQQTCNDYELILIDDGSTDKSGTICDEYSKISENIRVIHKSNGGLSDARNVGIDNACGDYVIFIDSDDYLVDLKLLEKAKEYLLNKELDVLLFEKQKFIDGDIIDYFYNEKSIVEDIDVKKAVEENLLFTSAWCKIIKRNLFNDNNLNFEINKYSEDMNWCARLLIIAKKYGIIRSKAYAYRQRKGSISKSITEKHIKDIEANIESCLLYNINSLDNNLKDSYYVLLARNFSAYLIALATSSNCIKEDHYDFIIRKKNILKYSNRNREKLINYFLQIFGIKTTLFFLKKIYELQNGG